MIYSFRAECQLDVDEFIRITGVSIRQLRKDPLFPDVEVEVESAFDLGMLVAFTERVEDAHVIRQTIRACPLSDNSLDRIWERGYGESHA